MHARHGYAEGQHLEVLRWAREHDSPWDPRICSLTVEGGREPGHYVTDTKALRLRKDAIAMRRSGVYTWTHDATIKNARLEDFKLRIWREVV